MMIRFTKDVMEELKRAGWSEYRIRKENALPSSAVKALKAWDTSISMRSVDKICELLGGVPIYTFLEYYDPLNDAHNHANSTGFAAIRERYGKPC